MQYALLIYRQPGDTDTLSPAELLELSSEYWACLLYTSPSPRD